MAALSTSEKVIVPKEISETMRPVPLRRHAGERQGDTGERQGDAAASGTQPHGPAPEGSIHGRSSHAGALLSPDKSAPEQHSSGVAHPKLLYRIFRPSALRSDMIGESLGVTPSGRYEYLL